MIKRRNHGRGHSYIDTDTGEKIRSVTDICKGVPKHLEKWAAETTANYAVDHWDELSLLLPTERLKLMYGARTRLLSAASVKGTKVHALASRLVVGEAVDMPPGLEGYVNAYIQFLDDFDVRAVLAEAVVVSHENRYCGTLDLVANLTTADGDETWLLDIKTGNGVYGETALQLAGYRYADAWVDDEGTEYEMPDVDRAGVVHLRDGSYELLPVVAEERQHRQFLYAAEIVGFLDEDRDLIGEPIPVPRAGTYRLESTDDDPGF